MFDVGCGRNLLAALTVTLLAAGCGGGAGTSTPAPPFEGDPSQVLTVVVRNEQIDMARITLFINSLRRRLGDVRGLGTQTFHVPMDVPASVRLEFDLTLGANCVTRDIVLGPGDVVQAVIPVDLRMMQAVCRGG
jgi:hypothetical protein